jgi:hypothetical protein
MWSAGAVYNFCCPHRGLRQRTTVDRLSTRRRLERTPAQAAGLTDRRWSVHELLLFPVPGVGIKRRGRRPKWLCDTVRVA